MSNQRTAVIAYDIIKIENNKLTYKIGASFAPKIYNIQ